MFLFSLDSTSKEIDETYVYHRQQHYLNELLVPDSPYTVSVWAETNGGEGPKVTKHLKTYPLRKPDIPYFSAKSTTPNSISVNWHPGNSSDWKMSGAAFYVNYSKTGKLFGVFYFQIRVNRFECMENDRNHIPSKY